MTRLLRWFRRRRPRVTVALGVFRPDDHRAVVIVGLEVRRG